MTVGQKFDNVLRNLNLSSKDIALEFAVSQQYISNLKKSKKLNEFFIEFAKKYSIDLNWFVDESEESNNFSNAVFNSSVGINNGTSTITSPSLSNNIPDYILDDLGSLFKRCEDKKDELIDALDDFIFEQKKKCR